MSSVEHFSTVVWEDLGSPSSPSMISISGWSEANLGILNVWIDECYVVQTGDFSPQFTNSVSGIYKEIYKVKYYESQIKSAVNNVAVKGTGTALDWVELREGDTTIRRSSPAEMSRIYRGLKSDAQDSLDKLIHAYKRNEATPGQIVGDEFSSVWDT